MDYCSRSPTKYDPPSIDTLLPVFLQAFKAALEGPSWNAAQLLFHNRLSGHVIVNVIVR
jgi:hypothetical protein